MNTEEDELVTTSKSCPFCGSADLRLYRMQELAGPVSAYAIGCPHCQAVGPEKGTYEQALWAWDSRGEPLQ